jgi:hypothetical protein
MELVTRNGMPAGSHAVSPVIVPPLMTMVSLPFPSRLSKPAGSGAMRARSPSAPRKP